MSETESFGSVMEAAMPLLSGDCVFESCPDEHDDCMHCAIHMADRLRRAHNREIRDMEQQQYSRGYHDGQHSMDAEHRAVAMRLRQLPRGCTGFSDAHVSWFADLAWAMGIKEPTFAVLRDELVRLMGGVSDENVHVGGLRCDDGCVGDVSNGEDTGRTHDSSSNRDRNHMAVRVDVDTVIGDSDDTCACAGGGACAADCGRDSGKQVEVSDGGTANDSGADTGCGDGGSGVHMDRLVTYDVLWNERQKAIAKLRKCDGGYTLEWDNIYEIFDALGVDYVGMAMAEVYENLRDRLIHLLGGDQPSGIDVLSAMDAESDDDGTCPIDVRTSSITDELRKWASTAVPYKYGFQLHAIADRIDEQFDRICAQQEAVLQSTVDGMCEEQDRLQAKLDRANGENKGLRLSVIEQKEAIIYRKKTIKKLARDNEKVWKTVHELQAKLDEYDRTHIELPRDKNGEVFCLGCTVRMVGRNPEVLLTVHGMTVYDDGEWWLYACDDKEKYSCNLRTSEFEVCDKPQDTAESIVRDLSMGSITESLAIERIGALNG